MAIQFTGIIISLIVVAAVLLPSLLTRRGDQDLPREFRGFADPADIAERELGDLRLVANRLPPII